MLLLILLMLLLTGCSGIHEPTIFNTEPYADTVTDKSGKKLLADTPRNWRDWKDSIDAHIANEAAGEKPSGGIKSWNIFWCYRIKALNDSQENYEKYVAYIIDRRRVLGLPEWVAPVSEQPEGK